MPGKTLVTGMGPWLARCVATAWLILAGAAPAPAQGTVEGSLELAGERVPISHVYAREGRPRPGSGEPPDVIILMTDRPAPPEVVASRQAYYAAASTGRIRGALLVLQPDPRFVLFAPGGSRVDTAVPDRLERLTLAALRRENGTVSGHLRMSEAGELAYGQAGAPDSYRVDLRFSAPVAPAPQPREVLTGEAARNSPQAAMALRALRILQTGSVAELRAAFHPDHSIWIMSSDDAAAILEIARLMLPAPETFLASIERILVYDDAALVVARDADGGGTIVSLRRDGDAWKFADAPIAND
jgi:hypothetical protein